MSGYVPNSQHPDGRVFASYPMPAKIDLLAERPRRDSLLERQLDTELQPHLGPSSGVPLIQISSQSRSASPMPTGSCYSQNSASQQILPQGAALKTIQTTTTTTTTTTSTSNNERDLNEKLARNKANLAAIELAEKEAKLLAEIQALQQRPYSPYQVPPKIDLTSEHTATRRQYEIAPSPRPNSRASSTRCTSADLLDKEARLLQEIEEMERKPFNPQTMVLEREQWYEYPRNRPNDKRLTETKRRVRDFCSLPPDMYQDGVANIHEEDIPVLPTGSSNAASIHTTIIRSPKRDVDNRSPLPFAFDNFSTKGVRGNIASVGAVEPERPQPPIYPIVKRSPTPSARG